MNRLQLDDICRFITESVNILVSASVAAEVWKLGSSKQAPQVKISAANRRNCLEQELQLRASIAVLVVVLELREEGNESILRAEDEVVVQPPINLAHAACWMPEALQGVLENLAGAQGHAERLDRVEDVLRDMR